MDDQLQKNNQVNELELKNRSADYADVGIRRGLRQQLEQQDMQQNNQQNMQGGLPANAPVEIPRGKLPRTLLDSLRPFLSWKKLRTDSARELKTSVQELMAAKTENLSADKLIEVVKAAIKYMEDHKGHRVTGSGEERKIAIRTFLSETAAYAPNAGSAFMYRLMPALQLMEDKKKYEKSFKADVRAAFENKYDTGDINTAINLKEANEEIMKRQIRAWGGMDEEAKRRLSGRENPGENWKHDVAAKRLTFNPVVFRRTMSSLVIPDFASMDDFQLLANPDYEQMRSKLYLPLLANFDQMVKDGEMRDQEEIRSFKVIFKTFEQELDQYEYRLKMIAGEIDADPQYGQYQDALQAANEAAVEAEHREDVDRFRQQFAQQHGRRKKPTAAQITAALISKNKTRAELEYNALRSAAQTEYDRLEAINAEKLEQSKQAEKAQIKDMLKAAMQRDVQKSKEQNREKRGRKIEEDREERLRLNAEELKRRAEEEARRQREREEALKKRRRVIEPVRNRYDKLQQSKKPVQQQDFDELKTSLISALSALSGKEEAAFGMLSFDGLFSMFTSAEKNIEDASKVKSGIGRMLARAEKRPDADTLYKSMKKVEKEEGEDKLRALRERELSLMYTEKKLEELGGKEKNRRFDKADLSGYTVQDLRVLAEALEKLPKADLKTSKKKEADAIHNTCTRFLALAGAGDMEELDRLPTELLLDRAKACMSELAADSAGLKTGQEAAKKSLADAEKALTDDVLLRRINSLSEEVKKGGEGADAARYSLKQYCARVFYTKAGAAFATFRNYEKISDADLAELARLTVKALTVTKKETKKQLSERRTATLAALTKLTGMPENAFSHIPMRDLKNLTASAVQELGVSDSVKKTVEDNIARIKETYAGPEAAKQLVERKKTLDADFAAMQSKEGDESYEEKRARYEKDEKRLREQCIFIILMDGDARLADVEALPNTTLLSYAHAKLSGAVAAGKMAEYINENQFSTEEEVLQALSVQQFAAYEEKKKRIREERAKTAWTDEATNTLNLLGDLLSGETQYDKAGHELEGADKIRQVLLTHKEVLKKLCAGRKQELNMDAGIGGPMKELLSNVLKGEDQLIRGVKGVLDEILDAVNGLANKDAKADMDQLLRDESLNKLLLSVEDKLKNVVDNRADKLEDQVDVIADEIFEDEGLELPDLFAEDQPEHLSKEEEEIKKKQEEKERLKKLRTEIYSKEHAQGRFIQNLTRTYIKESAPEVKRMMLSCMLKDIRPKMYDKEDRSGMNRAGRYLASMIKGAGPMMQKIMQGIPESVVRMEMAPTLQVVKSDLRDIPESYVNTVLEQIKNETPNVKTVVKKKALGAASIAQTFLCEFEDMKGKKTMKVVKILRPDAEAKFEKEKDMIIRCAKEADPTGVMESAVMAHMSGVEKELDFRSEAVNCDKGKVYNTEDKGRRVRSVKLDKGVKPAKGYMVMDKAEGITVDQYILELKNLAPKYLSKFLVGEDPVSKKKIYRVTPENYKELAPVRKELMKQLKSAEKRQKHVALLAEKWVDEALFGSYFHHGDLHAGNIMVNDDCATVLDYGNANQLSKEQMKMIVKMMAGAFVGKTDVFIRDLGELLKMNETLVKGKNGKIERKPDPIEITEDQKKALKEKLDEVFKLGGVEATGDKIFVALMKAQEVGIKIPAEIQNFSQCEQRLENTLSELNSQVENLRGLVKAIDCMDIVNAKDYVNICMRVQHNLGFDHERNMEKLDKALKEHAPDKEIFSEKKLEEDLKNLKPEEFEKKYMKAANGIAGSMPKIQTELEKANFKNLEAYVSECRALFKKAVAYAKEGKSLRPLRTQLSECSYQAQMMLVVGELRHDNALGPMTVHSKLITDAFSGLNEDAFEELMAIFTERIPAYQKLKQDYDTYRRESGKWFNGGKTETAKATFLKNYRSQKTIENLEVSGMDYMETMLKPYSSINSFTNDNVFDFIEDELTGKRKEDVSTYKMFEKTEKGDYVLGEYAKLVLAKYEEYKPFRNLRDKKSPEYAKRERIGFELKSLVSVVQDLGAVERSKKLVEPELTAYFKRNPQLKTSLQDFRRAQLQWIDARIRHKDVVKAKVQMLLAKKEFCAIYKKLATEDLLERKKTLSEKVGDEHLTDFIEAMKKSFSWGRMVMVFNFGLGDYMPDGEEIPEEFEQAQSLEQKQGAGQAQ